MAPAPHFTRETLARGPDWAERVRKMLPGKLKEIPGDLIAPIAVATTLVIIIELVRDGAFSFTALAGLLPLVAILFVVSFFFGRWCGRRVWPLYGTRLAKRLLGAYGRSEHHTFIISGRADHRPSTNRRVFEATMLIASLQVLAVLLLALVLPQDLVFVLGFPIFIASVIAGFLLVPHWEFGRLGIRRVDNARFTVVPVTRDYSDRLKLSNGAVVLIVIGIGTFLLRQEGRSDVDAAFALLTLVLNTIIFTLIVSASAVAFYQRREQRVMESIARYAVHLGARDGRGESHVELALRIARPSVKPSEAAARLRRRPPAAKAPPPAAGQEQAPAEPKGRAP